MYKIAVSREFVIELSKATRLELSEEEIDKYTQQLNVILDAFKELDEVHTEDVEPSYHPIKMTDRLREDESHEWDWEPLENVSEKDGRHIRGPKIK
jgi:aspartyl-tRNA(Asn)/glutamyl-tRNA(Gln) amidotransferase subunit C